MKKGERLAREAGEGGGGGGGGCYLVPTRSVG